MSKQRQQRRRLVIAVAVVITLVVATFLFMPTGKYVEVPGSASVTSKFVHVAGKRDRQRGSYRLMTVSVIGPASPAVLLWAHWQPFAEVDSKAELMGSATTSEYTALQRYYIKSAANDAVVAAMRAAHRPVSIHGQGIYVMSLLSNSPCGGISTLVISSHASMVSGMPAHKAIPAPFNGTGWANGYASPIPTVGARGT